MSRISSCFKELKAQDRVALIPFVTAGDPEPDVTVPLMHRMVAAGADIIELGVPFSDPMAEGPVIQRACERALAHNTSLLDVIAMVRQFRENNQQTPVVLMGYLNPIEIMGYLPFASEAATAGVDGVLTVDMPPEEADEYKQVLKKYELDPIFLMAPTSSEERIKLVNEASSGFIYYVSLKGITGASHLAVDEVVAKVAEIRNLTSLPVGVGFGIRDPETAQAMARVGDAVVVGSALVRIVGELVEDPDAIIPAVAGILSSMRQAIDMK